MAGTFIHELCHFVAREIFENEALPYTATDIIHKDQMKSITSKLQIHSKKIGSLFSKVFTKYDPSQHHQEIIVRVPQFILSEGAAGLKLLKKHVPELLEFYEKHFLEAVKNHVVMLEKKAARGWSLPFLATNGGAGGGYHFEAAAPK